MPMAEALPAIPVHRVEPYVRARIQGILDRLIPRYWSHEVTTQELYGAIGAIAELHALLSDIQRQQRQSDNTPRDAHGIVYERS
jgi:hypothetical protein